MKKILFEYEILDEFGVESIWTTSLGNDVYRIENIPFYAKEYAYKDLVKVKKINDSLYVDVLYEESGNSVIRILFNEEDLDLKQEVTSELERLGCGWEGSNIDRLISINVPKNIDYSEVEDFLIKGELLETFEYEEACISEKHQEDNNE
ncbi:DUF4265 domain-containing protein [Tenacibaculum aiptasiae]|uniref:DUF4265 domain-containing protein n=1 Tax=Tenacibaculum aiptasiae TaxID=426481 RepID=A0A7J5A751_9FLAO|nr:DUF4265 domain-containing protein [Tenacibaculum aiptasiae]KAB1153394.1 DUF4265 domain-containing protein [Tenacibaculum aiptasiae]